MAIYEIWHDGQDGLRSAMDDLAEARRQLVAADLKGAEQERLRSEVLAFCDDHDDALVRTCLEGHLTGSGLVVDAESEETLLIHHAKLRRWLQPGGHADGDGNLGSVAWREASEETGLVDLRLVTPAIDIDVHSIPARPGEPEHLHLDLRHLILVGPDRTIAPNHETLGARWMSADDPEIMANDELYRAVSRAVEIARTVAPAN